MIWCDVLLRHHWLTTTRKNCACFPTTKKGQGTATASISVSVAITVGEGSAAVEPLGEVSAELHGERRP